MSAGQFALLLVAALPPDAATSKSAQHFFDGGNSYVEEGLTPPWLGLSSPEEVISPKVESSCVALESAQVIKTVSS